MILFTLFMIALLIIAVVLVLVVGIGGTAFLLVFGDVIVFIWILVAIIRHIFKRKK